MDILYLVLRHPDADCHWEDSWEQNKIVIKKINTTKEILKRCIVEKVKNNRIAIYRCSHNGDSSMISCSAEVDRVDLENKVVHFKNQRVERRKIPKLAHEGQSYFYAHSILKSAA